MRTLIHESPFSRTLSVVLAAALLCQWIGLSLVQASPAMPPISGSKTHFVSLSEQYRGPGTPVSHMPRSTNPVSRQFSRGTMEWLIITVTNPTGGPVLVTQVTPPGTAFDRAFVLDDGGATWFMGGLFPGQSGEYTWFTGDRIVLGTGLGRSETAVLALVVRAVESLAGPSVGPAPPANLQAAPEDLNAFQANASTALALAKSDSPDPVNQGGLLTYVITVTNQTTETAQQVVVTDTTPAGTVFVSANVLDGGGAIWFHGGLSSGQAGSYTWLTGDRIGIGGGLAGDASAVLQFIVRPVGPFSDQGVVHNDDYRASALNASLTLGAGITTTINAPAFALSKVESSDPITAGARLAYTVFLTNSGHLGTSRPYTIVETLPAHTTYAASTPPAQVTGGTLTWVSTAPLGIGQAVSVTFAVTVTSPLTTGLQLVNDDYRAFSGEVASMAYGPPVTTTVVSWPDLSISKGDSPDPLQAGAILTYTLVVSNASSANGPALSAWVSDTLPALVAFQGCQPACVRNGQALTWTLGVLQPGQARQLVLTVRAYAPLPSGTLLTNHALVSASNALAPVETSAGTTVNSAPAFAVSKHVYPSAVVANSTVTYTLVITNGGNETATSARITDTLPASFAFGGMVQGDAPTQIGSDLIWSDQVITGTIWPPGWISSPGPLTLVFTATASGSGTYYNAITVTQGSVSATSGPTAPVLVSMPDLRVAKGDSPDPVTPGQPLAYTVVYSNASLVPATGVVVTDTLPSFITGGYASPIPTAGTIAAGQTITWTVGGLAGNSGNQTINLVVTVTLPLTDGIVLTNAAGISCNELVSAATGPITTTVQSAPWWVISKTVSHDPVHPGDLLTYTLAVTNVGTANATSTVITDRLPVHTTLVTASVPFAGPTGGVITWDVGAVSVNAAVSRTLVVAVDWPLTNGLTLTNTAWVSCAEGSSASDSAVVTVSSQPALAIAKADHPDPVAALGTLVYTLTFTNTGDEVATDVWISDTLDTDTVFVSAEPPPTTQVGDVVGWHWGDLSPLDGPQTIVLTTTVGLVPDQAVLANNVILDSQQTAPIAGIVTTTVSAADLVVDKWRVEPPVIGPGDQVTYTLRVTNAGSLLATGVLISDVLPVGFTAVASVSVNAAFQTGAPPVYVWAVNDLAQGEWAAITLTAQAPFTPWGPLTRTVVNTATVTTTASEADLGDNQDTALVAVVPGPASDLALSAAPDTLPAGTLSTLTAGVQDAWGNPVLNGTPVALLTTLGAIIPPSGWVTTNGQATAQLTSTVAGMALVTAAVGSVADTAVVTFTAAAVHRFDFAPIADQTAGVGFAIAITAYDAYDNIVTWFTGTVSLSDPTGSIQPTTSSSFVAGVLASQVISITVARVNQPIHAVSGTLQSSSNPFTVTHDLPVALLLAPHNATVAAGQLLAYSAVASDTYGNAWTATSEVTFTASGGNSFLGAVPGNDVFSATVVGVNMPISGVIAGQGGPVAATTGVTVTHGQAVSLGILPRDATTVAGSWVAYTAVATDTFGNSWDATAETAWAAGGGNAFVGSVLSATVAGVWPVTGTLAAVFDSSWITITSGSAAALAMAPVVSPQTAGVGFGLVITATDAFGNVATNLNGTLILTDTTRTMAPSTWSVWTNGVAKPTVTVLRAWVSDRITVTLAATPTVLVVSNPFTVVANVPAVVAYTVPASLRVCESSPVTATVTDAWNNPVAPGTVVSFTASIGLSFAESGGQIAYASTVGGAARVTLVAGTLMGLASTEARSGSASSGVKWVNVTRGLPATVAVAAVPGTVPVGGSTGTLTVTVHDCGGNPVADGTVVDFTLIPALAAIAPDPTATTGGVATAVFTSGVTAGGAVVTAVAGGRVGTTTLTFVAGPVYTVTLDAIPATLTANGSDTATLTVTTTDQYGNPVADGTPVDFSLSPLLGTIVPDPTTTTGGVAQAIFTVGLISGTARITATVGGRSDVASIQIIGIPAYFVYLPLVACDYGILSPDLVVDSIVAVPSNPTVGTPLVVSVTVRNTGSLAVSEPFWVDLYLDPSAPPQAGDLWNDLCLYGKAWYVRDPIPVGGTFTVNTTMPDDPSVPGARYSNWPTGGLGVGAHTLWAQVDSYLAPPGDVVETDETDNILGPVNLVVSSVHVFMFR